MPLGTNSVPTTVNPSSGALAAAAAVAVLEKPSSAEMKATVLGLGEARSLIACRMLVAYDVAGERTAKVRW